MNITKRNYHKASFMQFTAINDVELFNKLSNRKSFQYKKVKYTLQFESLTSFYYHTSNNEIVRLSDHWSNTTSLNTTFCLKIKSCVWNIEGVTDNTPNFIDFGYNGDDVFIAGICKLDTAKTLEQYNHEREIAREAKLSKIETLSFESMLESLSNVKQDLIDVCDISIVNVRSYIVDKIRTVVFDVETPFFDDYSKSNTASIAFKQDGVIQYIGSGIYNEFFNNSSKLIEKLLRYVN